MIYLSYISFRKSNKWFLKMDLKTFELLARYNVWSIHKLNQVLKTVSNDDFNAECGLYFKSIAGTLNHLLVGEHYLWFPRF